MTDPAEQSRGRHTRESITSFAQRGMWLAERIAPGTPMYTVANAYKLIGPLNTGALHRSLQAIVDRHEVLRTGFALTSDDVVQRVAPPSPVPLPVTDLSRLPPPERERRVDQIIGEAGLAVLDLAAGDVFRALLIRQDASCHILVTTVHHIAFDAWSQGVFLQELAACYGAFSNGVKPRLPPLPLQYADFAADQRRLVEDRLTDGVNHWRRQLADLPDTELPPLGPRPEVPGWRSDRLAIALPARVAADLARLSRQRRTTPFMTYLAALQVLLSRYTGAHDLSVATAVSGRTASELEGLIGLFVNTLILRGSLADEPTFADFLDRTRAAALDGYAHQGIPFDHVVDELGAAGTLGRNPFTQVFFVMQETGTEPRGLPGLEVQPIPTRANAIRADLRLGIELGAAEAWATWDYRTDLYDASYVASVGSSFVALLEGIAADPHARIGDLPLLTRAQRDRVIALGTGRPLGQPADTLHSRFARQARATPHAPAVVADDATLSYCQLDHAAERLAVRLRRAGCAAGDRVAVAIDRCAAMAVAVLGTLKAGACYVPIDPGLPARRWSTIIAEAGPTAVLLTEPAPLGLDLDRAVPVTVDVAALCEDTHDHEPAPAPVDGGAVAYVLYTSGSTGVPKGVAVTHHQVLSYLNGVDRVAGLPAARYAMVQPLAVDAAVTMLYGAWYHGGTLHLVSRGAALDAPMLADLMRRHQIEVLKIAPSHLQALQTAVRPAELMPARWLMIGGEASRRAWALSLTTLREGCAVYNHYGPTEATVGVLMHRLGPADGAPNAPHHTVLGVPLSGTRLYVLDRNGQPLPPMVAGEIFIGGALVALGYHTRAALTAESFLPDPVSPQPGSRMYRTGDRGRIRPDGVFEFLGRDDDQIKVRGYRVEPSEIAAVLQEHRAVRQAVVRPAGGAGEPATVAFVALRHTAPGHPVPETIEHDLLTHVAQRLPSYMVPAAIMRLDDLPLSTHGKVDVGALSDVRASAGNDSAPAATPLEDAIITIWRDLLGTARIGRHDDFFRLGGHSLLATRAAGRLTSTLGTAVPVATMFRYRTPAALAVHLRQPGGPDAADPVLVDLSPIPEPGTTPVLCLHPVGGTVTCYAELAGELTGRRMVGVQAPIPDRATPASVPALANAYLAAVRRRWPRGPLVLIGWSMGGLLAYELAQQLAATGDPPWLTVLIDTVLGTAAREDPSEPAVAAALARYLATGLDIDRPPPEEAELARLDHQGRLAAIQRWLAAGGEAGVEGDLARRYEVFRANLLAQRRYQPDRSAVPVTLVGAAETPSQEARWRRLVGDRLTVTRLPGDHYSLLRRPTVTALAGWLGDHIDAAVRYNSVPFHRPTRSPDA